MVGRYAITCLIFLCSKLQISHDFKFHYPLLPAVPHCNAVCNSIKDQDIGNVFQNATTSPDPRPPTVSLVIFPDVVLYRTMEENSSGLYLQAEILY
jgi:hypothetical protein